MKLLKSIICVVMLFTVAQTVTAQKKKVAVVTFYANKMVDYSALEIPAGEMMKELLDLRNDPNFNLTPLLETYHSNFFNDYAKSFPFELLPESVVTENKAYQDFQPKYDLSTYDALNYLLYPGYKYIYEGFMGQANEIAIAKMFENEADGVMFVNIDFSFQKGFGVGKTMSIKMRATTRIALYNKKGEKVFAFSEGENSKKTGVMVKGIPVMKPEKILPMCESALNELMGDLDKRIEKIVKKTEAKL